MLVVAFSAVVFISFNHECPHAWASPRNQRAMHKFCRLYSQALTHRYRVEGGVESPVTAVPMKGRCEKSIFTSVTLLCLCCAINPLPCGGSGGVGILGVPPLFRVLCLLFTFLGRRESPAPHTPAYNP